MRKRLRTAVSGLLVIGLTAACGGHESKTNASAGDVNTTGAPVVASPAATTVPVQVDSAPAKHHSKLGGALAGAAVGHVLGGHAVAGAAAGAMIQHSRNKH